MRLTGRVALVIGGSAGIGRACVDAFAADGASVVVADVNDEGGEQAVADVTAAGGKAAFAHTTIMEEESVGESVRVAVDTFGGLNILVTSVAGRPPADVGGRAEAWKYMVDMFQTGPYYASRQALPAIVESGNGSVIHVASIAGIRGMAAGDVDATAYPTSKHGVIGLTKTLALQYGPKGVRVNAICPGYVKTQLNQHLHEADTDGSFVRDTLRVPLERWGRPEEIGTVAAFLASDEASFISGQAIVVDGGMTAR
ncbi:MAG: SDR family oxidoreductase [Acidimicrobiia bacterium]|nr:SDR family oxidoreductase [Acidimicrobiia bacterium]MBV9040691.1 SDR family oxidoreductase [Acidimicrobiia bacterium]